jgi:hypothetical protein
MENKLSLWKKKNIYFTKNTIEADSVLTSKSFSFDFCLTLVNVVKHSFCRLFYFICGYFFFHYPKCEFKTKRMQIVCFFRKFKNKWNYFSFSFFLLKTICFISHLTSVNSAIIIILCGWYNNKWIIIQCLAAVCACN